MNYETELTLHERVAALEQKVEKQEAQIDALITVLSDTLAAHAVLHKDIRPFSFITQYRDYAEKQRAESGTRHIKASFFAARRDLFASILEDAVDSIVFDQYWHRSIFWWREEKERSGLEKIRKAVERKCEGGAK